MRTGEHWEFDEKLLVLRERRGYYEVDLENCCTCAQMLDWIMQVAWKTWATDSVLADLVRLLNRYLMPQENLCSFGNDKGVIKPRQILEKILHEETLGREKVKEWQDTTKDHYQKEIEAG